MYGIPRAKPAHAPRAGAKIHGPGTGTSDSVKTAVPAGSYIMPADSTEQLGFGVPRAGASQVPVNVSNGETAIPPEQVHAFGVRALNEMKNATHKPTGQPSAAGGELFFADGGLVEDPEKKWTPEQRAQKQAQLAQQTEQLRQARTGVPSSVPGNQARAAAMQAQYDQPVTGPRTPQPSTAKPIAAGVNSGEQPGLANDMADGLAGAAKWGLGLAGYPGLAIADGVRNLAGSVADGNTDQLEQYRDGASSLMDEGGAQMSGASASLRERSAASTRDMLGIDKAPAAVAQAPKAPAVPSGANQAGYSDEALAGMKPPAGAAAPQDAPPAADGGNGYFGVNFDAKNYGDSASKIAVRVGSDGVPEFTNDAQAVAGAQAMPADGFGARMQRPAQSAMPVPPGARPLAAGSNAPDGNADLASRGSAANVGNGVGTFSQMPAGSSQEAMARFERANQIRREQLAESGGIQVGGIRGKMSLDDVLQDKLGMRNRALDIEQQANQAELGLRGRELDAQLDRQDIQAQLDQQNIEKGDIELQQSRGQADLLARIQDPNTDDTEREQLMQQYRSLTTSGKDRYFLQDAVLGHDAMGTPIYGKQVVDTVTGKVVNAEGGSSGGAATASGETIAQPSSKAEYDALPKGAQYMKDGQIRIKS